MKVKTSELSGVQLDYAVACCHFLWQPVLHVTSQTKFVELMGVVYSPTTNWSQRGPLIEKEEIEFKWVSDATLEAHSYLHDPHYSHGLTHQEAACRLIVAAKLGDEVEIPDELAGAL